MSTNPLEVLPDRKKQLLLARFNGEEVENGVIISSPSPVNITPSNAEKESVDISSINSVPTRLDSFASPRESSRHDSNSQDAGSRSSSRLSVKENRQSNVGDGSAKRPLEFDNSDSIGLREEKSSKSKRTDRQMESPEPEKVNTAVAGTSPFSVFPGVNLCSYNFSQTYLNCRLQLARGWQCKEHTQEVLYIHERQGSRGQCKQLPPHF